jgi:hypothetical protein
MGFSAAGVIDWTSALDRRLSCVISCTPRAVSIELTQPMTPRNIIRIDASIKGAKALPKVSTKSDDPVMGGLLMRNMYALMNVNANRAIPTKRMTYAIVSALSFITWTSTLQKKMFTYNIKSSAAQNHITFNYLYSVESETS